MNEEEIVEILKRENEEFRRLAEEHRSLDNMLSEMDRKPYLTPDEEIERKRIQKLKLNKKDRMAELIREYKRRHSN